MAGGLAVAGRALLVRGAAARAKVGSGGNAWGFMAVMGAIGRAGSRGIGGGPVRRFDARWLSPTFFSNDTTAPMIRMIAMKTSLTSSTSPLLARMKGAVNIRG